MLSRSQGALLALSSLVAILALIVGLLLKRSRDDRATIAILTKATTPPTVAASQTLRARRDLSVASSTPVVVINQTPVVRAGDLQRDPRYQVLSRIYTRRSVWRQKGVGILATNLSSADRVHLVDLLVSQAEARNDAVEASAQQDFSQAMQDAAAAQAIAPSQAEIDALLGPGGSAAIEQAALDNRWVRLIDATFGSDLASNGLPMDSTQTRQLAQVARDTDALRGDVAAVGPEADGSLSEKGAAIVAKAQPFLSPEQLSILTATERTDFAEVRVEREHLQK